MTYTDHMTDCFMYVVFYLKQKKRDKVIERQTKRETTREAERDRQRDRQRERDRERQREAKNLITLSVEIGESILKDNIKSQSHLL